jgi:hypothetical protein
MSDTEIGLHCMKATWLPATSGPTAARSPKAFAAI